MLYGGGKSVGLAINLLASRSATATPPAAAVIAGAMALGP